MLIDLDGCVGCQACVVACKAENAATGPLVYDPVISLEASFNGVAKTVFLPLLCMHCQDAPCIKACPSRAIHKRDDGIVVIANDRCCGFRACVTACPYGAIQVPALQGLYGRESLTPVDKYILSRHPPDVAQKCSLCAHRIDSGRLQPACVEVCPTACRIFGDMEDPSSEVSSFLTSRAGTKLRADAGSKPQVTYLLAIGGEEAGLGGGR